MHIRMLCEKDAPLMLEWMHDDSVVQDMQNNFKSKTLDDCKNFIALSNKTSQEIHMAIADEKDCYMGTVSLKNIDKSKANAEFAITVRKCAMGKGYSRYGMKEIIKKGFIELKLDSIYWYVKKSNIRAVKFYDKMQYRKLGESDINELEINKKIDFENFYWYCIENKEIDINYR